MMNLELETKVIERFVVKAKRKRYLGFIQTERTRGGFTGELAHFNDLRPELFEEVKGRLQVQQQTVKGRIKALGNLTDCYVISESSEFDQRRLDIDTALSEAVGHGMGAILVFGDAAVIYYEGEGPKERWLSKGP